MKALIITLLISSAVFATKYELNKTICDGKEVSISPENSVLSMIMDFHGPYKVDLLVNGVFSDSEMEFELNSKNPLTIITLQNGFYKFKKRGKSTCTITMMGSSFPCGDEADMSLGDEEFKMQKSQNEIIITMFNYVDEELVCDKYVSKFTKL